MLILDSNHFFGDFQSILHSQWRWYDLKKGKICMSPIVPSPIKWSFSVSVSIPKNLIIDSHSKPWQQFARRNMLIGTKIFDWNKNSLINVFSTLTLFSWLIFISYITILFLHPIPRVTIRMIQPTSVSSLNFNQWEHHFQYLS